MSASAHRRRRMVPGILASAAVLMASAGTAAGVTGTRPGGPVVSVAQGSGTAALASAKVLGATDPATPEDVSFILRARNLTGLEKRVQAGWGRNYLSARQFAAQYGQSPLLIKALEKYLQSFGISTTSYADDLDVSAHGTAGQFDKALSITEQDFRVRAPAATLGGAAHWTTVHGSRRSPHLPAGVGNPILAILGLSNYSPFVSHARKAPLPARSGVSAATTAHGVPAGELAPADFVNRYHLSSLEKGGALGQGTTIGIVTLAAIDPSVPLAFWNSYLGLHEPASRLTLVPVDGGAPGPSAEVGTGETDLDVEQSGAIAPKAHVRVYDAPNTDAGFADAFFAAASDNIADTVSVSWGESETVLRAAVASGTETPAYAASFDEVFAELGAQGQSTFAASGDSGAYDAVFDTPSTSPAVDEPASSPDITAAGGTTLPLSLTAPVTDSTGKPAGTESVRNPVERAWSWDYLWPLYKVLGYPSEAAAATDVDPQTSYLAGGGGGYSSVEARPSYQRGISGSDSRKYLTPTTYVESAPGVFLPTQFTFNSAPSLTYGYQPAGRGVPDLSADADPNTGYAVYDPAEFDGGFAQYGGTSFVSPQLNGATAVIDSSLGRRVGFWNPKIYRAAAGSDTPFTPLNSTTVYSGKPYLYQTSTSGVVTALPGEFSNNNLLYTGRKGAIWNPATGLGIPNLTALAAAFAEGR